MCNKQLGPVLSLQPTAYRMMRN